MKQPKDFTKINKSLLQKSIHGEKENEKELRKKLGNSRKKVKQGHKPQKLNADTFKLFISNLINAFLIGSIANGFISLKPKILISKV